MQSVVNDGEPNAGPHASSSTTTAASATASPMPAMKARPAHQRPRPPQSHQSSWRNDQPREDEKQHRCHQTADRRRRPASSRSPTRVAPKTTTTIKKWPPLRRYEPRQPEAVWRRNVACTSLATADTAKTTPPTSAKDDAADEVADLFGSYPSAMNTAANTTKRDLHRLLRMESLIPSPASLLASGKVIRRGTAARANRTTRRRRSKTCEPQREVAVSDRSVASAPGDQRHRGEPNH